MQSTPSVLTSIAAAAVAVAALASTMPALAGVPAEALPRIGVGDAIGGNAVVLVRPAAGTGSVVVEIARDAAITEIVSTHALSITNPLVPGKATSPASTSARATTPA
jgi:hypothetical protein